MPHHQAEKGRFVQLIKLLLLTTPVRTPAILVLRLVLPMRSIFLLLALTFAACAAPNSQPDASGDVPADSASSRLDPSMQLALRTAPADSVMGATVRASSDLSDEQRTRVEATGANVQTVIGALFTIRATPPQIRAVAALSFVVRVEGGRSYTTR